MATERLIRTSLGVEDDRKWFMQVWTSTYHVPRENGGALVLHPAGESVRFDLATGDAVLFRATTIPHNTTPIRPTATMPDPERVVIVGRFCVAE